MIQQTVFPLKIKTTQERLTAHGGLALMAEFNDGIRLRELTDQYLPPPGGNWGFDHSEVVDAISVIDSGEAVAGTDETNNVVVGELN